MFRRAIQSLTTERALSSRAILATLLQTTLIYIASYGVAHGFDNCYEVRSGHFDDDGLVDLYIYRRPAKQITDETECGDARYLVEGIVDSPVFSSSNQLIFGPSEDGAPPLGVTALDASLIGFFRELDRGWYDPNYFEDNAPIARQTKVVDDRAYLATHCTDENQVNERNAPSPIEPTIEVLLEENALFVRHCTDDGLTTIRYDFVAIHYQVAGILEDVFGVPVLNQDVGDRSATDIFQMIRFLGE